MTWYMYVLCNMYRTNKGCDHIHDVEQYKYAHMAMTDEAPKLLNA